ncbi:MULTISPECIES: glycosyltransferase family 2 protein [unclassified Haloarcula]|uniref:glycosyltransferase family 2 protein n=1 Tax=unclassified Haloarcula TaxID=2624677 RepID=UPI0009ADA521|nr:MULTISPECIES: glycosyltransferase family 2 protein [unclassified Haloarcula]
MDEKLVSVVITTYYRNDGLREAIESVKSQSYDNIEIIVVDDSGEKHAAPVVEEFDLTYIPNDGNIGVNKSRSIGIDATQGEYIQLFDDDDILRPTKIEKQVSVMESNTSATVVYCGLKDQKNNFLCPDKNARGDILDLILQFDVEPAHTSTLLFDGPLMRELSPFNSYPAATDMPFKIRASAHGECDFVDECLVVKKDLGNKLSEGLEYSDALLSIINDFEHLYENNKHLRDRALANAYRRRGIDYIYNDVWSFEAILSFAKTIYYEENVDAVLIGQFLGSLLGRPGYKTVKSCGDIINTDR